MAPDEVDHVVMGQVLMAGQGQVPSRQAAVKAGIPMRVPAVNVNKVCLSGLNAIYLADQMIAAGDADIVVAGGMESMTNAPYLAEGARGGFRYGNVELRDSIIADGLWCAFDACLMGLGTERYTAGPTSAASTRTSSPRCRTSGRPTRSRTVGWPTRSSRCRSPSARATRWSSSTTRACVPGTTAESLAGLRPAFDKDGTITAGNASQLSDGASAVVVMSERAADGAGRHRLGEFVAYGMVAGPDSASLLHQPSGGDPWQRSTGLASAIGDVDLIEINEAFAAVGLASMADLGVSPDVVNVNGGAIALGHPIGMSGNRLALTLLHELRRRGGGVGAAALCGGGGQGDALIVRSRCRRSRMHRGLGSQPSCSPVACATARNLRRPPVTPGAPPAEPVAGGRADSLWWCPRSGNRLREGVRRSDSVMCRSRYRKILEHVK